MERIRSDLYGIARELERDGYELYFNRVRGRFEVYYGGAPQLAVPFEKLDARTLRYVKKTRVENAEKLLREIEDDNVRAEEAARKEAVEKLLRGSDLRGVL